MSFTRSFRGSSGRCNNAESGDIGECQCQRECIFAGDPVCERFSWIAISKNACNAGWLLSFEDQVTHYIFAALGGVLAHVELEKRLDRVSVVDADLRDLHVGPDEGFEFCR